MEISAFRDLLLDPSVHAPMQEPKTMKAPVCDQDVERFESILSGEGPYQPKSLDLVMPATEPNAIQNVGQTILKKVTTLKNSSDSRIDSIHTRLTEMMQDTKRIKFEEMITLQYEISMFTIESTMMSKAATSASNGIKTLFRNQ